MKKTCINNILFGGLLIASSSVMATGFVTLNPNGFAAPGGTSAYTLCNITGNFGQGTSVPPSAGANNTCAIFQNNPPIAGYGQVANAVRNIVINGATIGTVTDRVWRSGTNCVYGAKIRLNNVDFDPSQAGAQFFEVNDFLRGGFRNRGPISIAYNFVTRGAAQSDEVLYRAGLTFTSKVTPPNPNQPLTSSAPISLNWVDYTTDVNYQDPDGSSMRDSPWFYTKSTCTTAAPAALAGALRLREMGQEGQTPLEISIPGYAPAGANTAP
ncbi:MAG: hypothetical protein ABL933_16470 [Methyloglobulus sp.]|nr:hypothetical protein [Methyloglobulus sp.]